MKPIVSMTTPRRFSPMLKFRDVVRRVSNSLLLLSTCSLFVRLLSKALLPAFVYPI